VAGRLAGRRWQVETSWAEGLFHNVAWTPTRALGRAVFFVSVCLLLGVGLGRLDLVALAAPFALGAGWALRRRPSAEPVLDLVLSSSTVAEDEKVTAHLRVTNPNPVPVDLAVVRVAHSRWIDLGNGDRPYATSLPGSGSAEVELSGPALRWGLRTVGPAMAYAVACDGMLVCGRSIVEAKRVTVYPQRPQFRAADMVTLSSALTGGHRSRRPGEGGELAGVRHYAPGDRLRRVDWRVTLRTRELHVAHTLSDRDAEVAIVLDVSHDAGRSGGVHGTASVVDTTVRAAAAIAEYYLRLGDRVSMIEYSGHPRHLRPASGGRHLQVVSEWLVATRATADAGGTPVFGFDPHLVAHATLVVVLSPLLAAPSGEMIAELARAGRFVIVVDTLGTAGARRAVGGRWSLVAHELWRLERENLVASLREAGVPVAPWSGAGTLDQMLRDAAQMAAAPRVGVR
jgi:uncharacterized protein (DUF58 family)